MHVPDHAQRVVDFAIDMQERVEEINAGYEGGKVCPHPRMNSLVMCYFSCAGARASHRCAFRLCGSWCDWNEEVCVRFVG